MNVKKFLKSLGIGFLAGLITFFICGNLDVSSAVFVLVSYAELRRNED